MAKKQKQQEEDLQDQFREYREEDVSILKKKSIKELIAPSGIDASNIDHLEILETDIRDILYRWINIVTSKRVCTI